MAIGDVKASGGLELQKINDRAGRIQQQGVVQLTRSASNFVKAGMGYLESEQRLNQMYNDRARKSIQLHVDTELTKWQRDRSVEYSDFVRDRSANPIGMTNDYADHLEKRTEEFLETVPEMFREEYAAKMRQNNAQRVSSAYIAEISAMEVVDKAAIEDGLNILGSALRDRSITLEDAEAQLADMLDLTSFAEVDKEAAARSGRSILQALEFGDLLEEAARGHGTVTQDWNGSDVVAAGLSPEQRGVLNAISSREAGSYDVWNGGARFEGYSDHPAAFGKAPGASTAAGRYQFTYGTWKSAKASYERTFGTRVPDFSPEWQDRVAGHWAEVIFNKWNGEGLDYKQVLMSGDPEQIVKIRRVLGNPKDPSNPLSVEWEGWSDRSFKGDGAKADEAFLRAVMGDKGIAGGGTGSPELPNIWSDERYADVSLEEKLKMASSAWTVADKWRKDEAARSQAQLTAFEDQMYELGYSFGNLDQMREHMSSPFWSNEAERKFRQGVEQHNRKQTSVGEVQSIVDSGGRITAGQRKAYGEWFGEDNYRGVASGDEEALNKLAYGFRQTGSIPPDMVKAYREAMDNPETRNAIVDLFARINAGSPGALADAGFTPKELTDLKAYQTIASASSPERTAELWAQRQDRIEQSGKTAAQLEREAAKLWGEGNGTDSLFRNLSEDRFLGKLWRWSPHERENLITPTGRQMFDREAFGHFQQGMMIFGDEKEAMTYAEEAMNLTWGLSYAQTSRPDGGTKEVPRLMKYPPERYYAPKDGEDDYGYLYEAATQLVADNSPEDVGFLPGSTRLVADRMTEQAALSGELPTYLVVAETMDGQLVTLDERFGGEELATVGSSGALDVEGKKVFEAEYAALTRTHTQTVALMTGGGLLRGDMALEDVDPESDAWRGSEAKVNQLEERIRATEDAAIEAGFVEPRVVDRERERREMLRVNKGLPNDRYEAPLIYSATLSALRESIFDTWMSEEDEQHLYNAAAESFAALHEYRPLDSHDARLWDRQLILRSMAEGSNLLTMLTDPQLKFYAGDIMPREWSDAASQFNKRLGERSQAVGERMTRQDSGVQEIDIQRNVLYGLATSWAGFGPGEAADIVEAILEEGGI